MPRKATRTQHSDARLVHPIAQEQRDSRSTADAARAGPESTQSLEERMQDLRDNELTEVLPTPPGRPGYVRCWLSTTNSRDPIFRRVRQGWTPVMAAECEGYEDFALNVQGSKYNGIISSSEMLLYEIPLQKHNDLMMYYHHVRPLEEESAIRRKLQQAVAAEVKGEELGLAEEAGFTELGRPKTPVFHC